MAKVIDLTLPIDPSIPQYPTQQTRLKICPSAYIDRHGFNRLDICLSTHFGTHIDAPYHVLRDGKKLDDFPIEKFVGEGPVLNIPKKDLEEITDKDLEKSSREQKLGVREGDIVFIRTGYDERWTRPEEFETLSKQGWKTHPALVVSAAEWLVKKKVSIVGIDTFAIRHPKYISKEITYEILKEGPMRLVGPRDVEPVHNILLKNDILIVEALTNLKEIAGKRVKIGIFPLPISKADGSPVRVVAFLE